MGKSFKVLSLSQAMKTVEDKGLRTMTEFELRSVGRPIMTQVKKQMKELRKEKLQDSPAYRAYKSLGLKTSTAAKDRNKLLSEVYNAYKFLNAVTSTVSGATEYVGKMERLFGRPLNAKQSRKMWAAVDVVRRKSPMLFEQFSSDQILDQVGFESYYDNYSAEEIADMVLNRMEEEMERQEYEMNNPFEDLDRDMDPLAPNEYWVGI